MYNPARQLSQLADRGLTVGFAESCSGGLLAASLVALPGASEVFMGAVVSYSNKAKENLLSVPAPVLQKWGAVSYQTAMYMAKGAARAFSCDVAISVTGIAGPGGGTCEKPVGLVYIGFYFAKTGKCFARKYRLSGDREQVRQTTVCLAWQGLSEYLQNNK